MASKLKRNDEVIVITGKDKGRRGKIRQILSARGRVLVDGINKVKKTLRKFSL